MDRRKCDRGAHVPKDRPTGDADQMQAVCRGCGEEIISNWYDDEDRAVGYGPWMVRNPQGAAK